MLNHRWLAGEGVEEGADAVASLLILDSSREVRDGGGAIHAENDALLSAYDSLQQGCAVLQADMEALKLTQSASQGDQG